MQWNRLTISGRPGSDSPGDAGDRINLLQLVFPRHGLGVAAGALADQAPPSTGLVTLAAHLRSHTPHCGVQVIDGNHCGAGEIDELLHAPVIGLSAWFSNYHEACRLARVARRNRPTTLVVMGGPHVSGLGPARVLRNNPDVDVVVSGDGERPLLQLLQGQTHETIEGLAYRGADGIVCNPRGLAVVLDSLPVLDLDCLAVPYVWKPWAPGSPSTLGFPVSAVRGCPIVPRCDYCSIPTEGVTTRSPAKFWSEILHLRRKYGINLFFETADIFPLSYASKLLAARDRLPQTDRSALADVHFRVYLRPGMINRRSAEVLQRLGVKNIFIGYESIVCFAQAGRMFRDEFERCWTGYRQSRIYPEAYTLESVFAELRMLQEVEIDVMAAFILGLPGENARSLELNRDFIRSVASETNVHELLLNKPLPLPGTELFNWCLSEPSIVEQYERELGADLRTTDKIDYARLADLFIDLFSPAGHTAVNAVLRDLSQSTGALVGGFGFETGVPDRPETRPVNRHSRVPRGHCDAAPGG